MAEADVVEGGMGKVGNVLTKKVGPLPVGVWVVVGGVAGYYIIRTRKAANGNAGAGVGGDGSGTVDATGSGTYSPLGSSAGNNNTGSGNGGRTTYSDNQAWGRAAIEYLVGLGYEGVLAGQAVQNYLASYQLTTSQQAMINRVITAQGAPPEAVPPMQTNPNPVIPGAPPDPVTGLSGKVNGPKSITVSWSASAGATKYLLTVNSPTYDVKESETSALSVTLNDVKSGADNVVTVRASNGTSASAGKSVTVHTPPLPPNQAPPVPSGGGGGSGGGGTFTRPYWDVVPGDNLWTISAKIIVERTGRAGSNAEIKAYSDRLYAANRGTIGNNPNLIKPGQRLVTP